MSIPSSRTIAGRFRVSQNNALQFDSVSVSQSPLDRFEEYLQSRGLRNTDQRRYLVEQVFSRHEHFDADQLIDQLPRKGQANHVSGQLSIAR